MKTYRVNKVAKQRHLPVVRQLQTTDILPAQAKHIPLHSHSQALKQESLLFQPIK